MILKDFTDFHRAEGVYYGGDAGAKNAIVYNDSIWLLKFPKTTRFMARPQISYTTSPLSEYIGSKIYETLGLPVHEVKLGTKHNKIVAVCKDFTRSIKPGSKGAIEDISEISRLIPFHDLKNAFMTSDTESYTGSGSATILDEVLATIEGQDTLAALPGVTERFWDMFVIDAFIGNSDRNNGNWGILINNATHEISLAPVYDNGNAFYNKRSIEQMSKRLANKELISQDAVGTLVSAYQYTQADSGGHSIKPFEYIAATDNEDCKAALVRFAKACDMNKIEEIIDEIPESVRNLSVMPRIQKDFYKALLTYRAENALLPNARN